MIKLLILRNFVQHFFFLAFPWPLLLASTGVTEENGKKLIRRLRNDPAGYHLPSVLVQSSFRLCKPQGIELGRLRSRDCAPILWNPKVAHLDLETAHYVRTISRTFSRCSNDPAAWCKIFKKIIKPNFCPVLQLWVILFAKVVVFTTLRGIRVDKPRFTTTDR